MSWVLPFLFMQLLLKTRNAIEFVDLTPENFLTPSAVGLAFFCLFVGAAISRFLLVHYKEPGM